MGIRTFLIILGFFFAAVLVGMYFISKSISLQLYEQYIANTNRSQANFYTSLQAHQYLFDNITQLKKNVDPIIASMSNVSHLNHLYETDKIFNLTLKNDKTIDIMNKTINDILNILNMPSGTVNSTVIPINKTGDDGLLPPVPAPLVENTTTGLSS